MLAPMAGMSDLPYREICRAHGAGYAVGEMTTCQPQFRTSRKSATRWACDAELGLRVVQLLGADPAMMADAARYAEDSGAQVVDINMGCPAKKVLQTACGSALMKDEALVARILEAVCAAVSVPVTLKIRTGWDREHRNALSIAGIANGDIDSGEKARRVMALTGADGVMIGRASYGNPWIFSEVGAALGHLPERKAPGLEERHAVICDHMRRHFDYYGGARGAVTFRKHLSHYLKGLPGSEALLGELFATSDADVLGAAVSRYFERLQDDEQGLG